MKASIIFSLWFICTGTIGETRAQNFGKAYPKYDSLIARYVQSSDSTKLADVFVTMTKDPEITMPSEMHDSVLLYAAKVFKTSGAYSDVFHCYNLISVSNFTQGNNLKALDYALKAIGVAKQNHLNLHEAIAESNIASIYTKLGDYEQANECNFKALKIFSDRGNELHIARCNLGIGSVYHLLHEYEKAAYYFKEADKCFVELGDHRGHSICLTNIGSTYNETGAYKQALDYFSEAVSICDIDNDMDGKASNYSNIGNVYYNLMDYGQAINYYQKSVKLCSELNNNSLLSSNYLQLSRISALQNQFDSAYDYCVKCLELTDETGEKNTKRQALEQLSDLCYKHGKYKEAFEYYHQAAIINDSLLRVEKSARITLLEERFNNEKLEKEKLELMYTNDIQTAKIRNQNLHIMGFAVIIFVLSVSLVLILVLYKKKNAAYKWIVKKNLDVIKTEQKMRNLNESINNNESKGSLSPIPNEEQKKIIHFIETDFKERKIYTEHDLTLEKLAKYCNTNRTYLSKVINEAYRMNYTDFINGYRISEAVILLSDRKISQKYSIEAIANESGYANISSFNLAFKKITGLTPSVFRRNAMLYK